MLHFKTAAAGAVALACAACFAQTAPEDATTPAAPATPAAAPAPSPLTANLSLVSDYRFRGISQSWRRPAVQGGVDYVHPSGFYIGNWNSSVSSNSYNNGASLEMDFYGGYRFEVVKDTTLDFGALYYYYPSAQLNRAPGVPTSNRYNNGELYAAVTYGSFNAKLSYAVTDYFGLNGQTAGYAYWSPLPDRGSSRGTMYLDLNYSFDLGNQFMLGLHAGHTAVRNYSALSYTDWRVSVSREWSGFNFSLAAVGTNADGRYYQVGDSSGRNPRAVGAPTLVLGVTKSF